MGLYDREYMREPDPGARFNASHVGWWLEHFNFVFMAGCVVGWFFTVAANESAWTMAAGAGWTEYAVAFPDTFMQGWVWTPLTYVFVESNLYTLFFNMLLLWYFGDEVKALYGRANLIWLYCLGTVLPAAAFLTMGILGHLPSFPLFGGGPLVMCVLMLITLWFPTRLIYFMGFLPVPLFLLTALYIVMDLTVFQHGGYGRMGVIAPLTGAAVGALFYFLDLRIARAHALGAWLSPTSHLKKLFDRRGTKPQPGRGSGTQGKVLDMYEFAQPPANQAPKKLPASDAARVDALLDKIAKQGKESLTPEEIEFLTTASQKYR